MPAPTAATRPRSGTPISSRPGGHLRAELPYLLDPTDAMDPGYPSETFRVLKRNEIARVGEYRTARLALAASDKFDARCRK